MSHATPTTDHSYRCSILVDVRWSSTPPGTIVDVDAGSADVEVEVLQQAWMDEHGRPRVRTVRVLGSRFGTLSSPAWVVAWARPAGAREWRWVLLMWQDKPLDPPGPHLWRWEWLEPDMALLRPNSPTATARLVAMIGSRPPWLKR